MIIEFIGADRSKLDSLPNGSEVIISNGRTMVKMAVGDAKNLLRQEDLWKSIDDDSYDNRMIARASSNKNFVMQMGTADRSYPRHTKVSITKG